MASSIEERTLIELYLDLESPSLERVTQNTERNLPAVEDSELAEQLASLLHRPSTFTGADFRKADFTDIIGY